MRQNEFLPVDEQLRVLTRGIVDFYVQEELKKKLEKSLASGVGLTIKAGFDPTAPDLHLGHAVLLTKMRQFQDLGHRVIFLIGDFTARIGDPTGKNVTRPPLSADDIKANTKTYTHQAFKILDPQKTTIQYNSEWLGQFDLDDVVRLMAKVSVARIIERDDFKKRLDAGRPISMHELMYPLLQGYDSVAMKPDVELGGSDQLFNLLVGRDLMRQFSLEPQCVMTVPLLEGIEAREENGRIIGDKMSKSLGNYVGFEDSPQDQFGKIMSICDALMWRYFELLSFKSVEEIAALKAGHPKQAKEALGLEIVTRFHGAQAAQLAQSSFHALFGSGKKHEVPADAPIFKMPLNNGGAQILDALVQAQLAPSKAEAKRLLRQGAISINGDSVEDVAYLLAAGEHAVRAGKKRWARIIVE